MIVVRVSGSEKGDEQGCLIRVVAGAFGEGGVCSLIIFVAIWLKMSIVVFLRFSYFLKYLLI